MVVLQYLLKLKRGLGLAFDAHFLDDLSKKNFPYIILYQLANFQWRTFFSSQDIK